MRRPLCSRIERVMFCIGSYTPSDPSGISNMMKAETETIRWTWKCAMHRVFAFGLQPLGTMSSLRFAIAAPLDKATGSRWQGQESRR